MLVDAMAFLPNYRNIPFIQEALAVNIRINRGNLYPVYLAGVMGLSEHPSIKKAIFEVKDAIISSVAEFWQESAPLSYVPVLMNDEDIRQVIADAKSKLLNTLREDEHLVNASILIQRVDWIREDSDVIEAVRDRLLDKTKNTEPILIETLQKYGLFQQNPVLKDTFERLDTQTQEWILRY